MAYTFTVQPPIYRTWQAYLAYFILAILALFNIINLRTAQLRTEKEKLELTVAERTAQIVKEKAEVEKQKTTIGQTVTEHTA